MKKAKASMFLISVIFILFLASCDVYDSLYGQEDVPLGNISDEVDKTIDEILPSDKSSDVTEDEIFCEKGSFKLSLAQAKEIALDSNCADDGVLELKDNNICNENTGTWWLDLDIEKEGCNPACVINVETEEAEINWRCTGLIPNKEEQETNEENNDQLVEEEKVSLCSDGIDNDEDGFIDFPDDFGCDSADDDDETNNGEELCNNGIDDDKDGMIDELDPGCNGFRTERGMEKIETTQEDIKGEGTATDEGQLAEPEEDAIVIKVQETELVDLEPEAEDPDKDSLTFTFSNPLDEDGQWQTTYGDSGEYTITVTVSDGELTSSQNVLVIVKKKEEAPTIDSFSPTETEVEIDETDSIEFDIQASDLNDDELIYTWKLDGDEVSNEESYLYETTYDDAGSHTVKADVYDGTTVVSQLWSITVNNVNRNPILEKIDPINVKETDTVYIEFDAYDPDGNELTVTISDPVGDDAVWETTYDDAGEYTVTVTVSDGEASVSQDVKITVENVNRPPVITDIVQKS